MSRSWHLSGPCEDQVKTNSKNASSSLETLREDQETEQEIYIVKDLYMPLLRRPGIEACTQTSTRVKGVQQDKSPYHFFS